MAAVFSLALHGGVPPPVQVKHVGRLLQIQTQTPDTQRQYQRPVLRASPESVDEVGPFLLRNVAGEREVEQSLAETLRRPLRRTCH